MNEEQTNQKREPAKITLGLVLSWGLGVLAAISGVTLLFSEPLTGILMLVFSAVLLPSANKFITDKFNFSISGGLKFILVVVLLGVIGATASTKSVSNNEQADDGSTQEQSIAKGWHEVQTFSGKGNQDTSSFVISDDKVKITAITSGGTSGIGTYSSVSLESDSGGYLGAGLSISTKGAEDGRGETTYRNLKPGDYYISVISGVNWEVVVEEYR
jgi:hypothetical protein